MQPFKALIALTSATICLVPCTDGFVALRSLSVPTSPGTAHVSSSSISTRRTHSSGYTSRPHGVLMATKGKKRKRRKDGPKDEAPALSAPTSAKAQPDTTATTTSNSKGSSSSSRSADGGTVVEGASQLGDVLEGDRGVEALFSDDWSDMPANNGMIKSNVALPDITKFKSTKRAETTLEQREKKTAVGLTIGKGTGDDDQTPDSLTGFQSKLPPIVDREEERLAKSAAERFDEGPVVKALKTATWFSICTLVLWEVYINSPWFPTPETPIM